MPQDDSKFGARWPPLNLATISYDLVGLAYNPYGPSCQNRHSGRAKAHEHKNGRSWALITSTEAGQQV
eukprot:5244112-Prymnesium_polylepis.1